MGIKWNDIRVGISPLTNSIFIGKSKPMKKNPKLSMWTDRSDDKTVEVINAVIDYLQQLEGNTMTMEDYNKKYVLSLSIVDKVEEV